MSILSLPPRTLRERLARHLHDARATTRPPVNLADLEDLVPGGTPRDAAVLVPLLPGEDGVRVLFTVRHAGLARHAGQVAFPGGRIDGTDADPVAAALREAHEEIGLPPAQVDVLGALDPMLTITGFRVFPIVGWIDRPFAPARCEAEVEEIFEVPLPALLDPARRERREREFMGRLRRYTVIRHGAHDIWGATAAMVLDLESRLLRCADDAA